MEAFGVIDILYKGRQARLRLLERLRVMQVNLHEYRDLPDAREHIGYFLEEVYMRKRVHSALGYVLPVGFEAHWQRQQQALFSAEPKKMGGEKGEWTH